jgi:hypothetical protein
VVVVMAVVPVVLILVAAAGGGGGFMRLQWLVGGGWWVVGPGRRWGRSAGLGFFCFLKIPSPRARWASRHMSAERGPACSRRRRLRRYSGTLRPSPRASSR